MVGVGILLSYWGGVFSGAFAVSFREGSDLILDSMPDRHLDSALESSCAHAARVPPVGCNGFGGGVVFVAGLFGGVWFLRSK